jgi:hypothetical protein
MTKPVKKKILVSVWKNLIALLNKKVDKACLNRDAYLDHVLRHEADKLISEIEIPNSPEARAHLSQHLALLDRKPVSFTLSPETIAAIDTGCQAKNIPRDCFMNRVLFMLVVDQRTFFRLTLFDPADFWPDILDNYGRIFDDHLQDGSLELIHEMVTDDPFFAVRACIDIARQEYPDEDVPRLHTIPMPKDLLKDTVPSMLGLNCYLPDAMIEGHPAQIEAAAKMEHLLVELDDLPSATIGGRP